MTVYLDLLFLFNFFVNAFFLYILELIYRERASRLRIVAGGFAGGLLVFVFLLDYFVYFLCKLAGGLLIAGIGLKKGNLARFAVKSSSFYLINLASVGLVESFRVDKWYFLIPAALVFTVLLFIENNKKTDIFINSLKYNISVTFNKKVIKTEGYLDTGNFSACDGLPIVYMAEKYRPQDSYYKTAPVSTVSGPALTKTYKPSSFIIRRKNKNVECDVLVAFTDLRGFDCLLNVELFITEGGKNV